MLPFSRLLSIPLIIQALAVTGAAKGIMVRFLAAPAAADSVARYDVYRSSDAGEPGTLLGSVPALAGADTLSLPDSSALKGSAYTYAIKAVNRAGAESDFSDPTVVGIPHLALPDTLRPVGGVTRFTMAPEAHPLRGRTPLLLSLADSSRILLLHDTATGRIEFRSRAGRPETVRVEVRGSYYGKFTDAQSVVIVTSPSPVAVAAAKTAPGRNAISLAPLPSGGWLLRGAPARGSVELYSASGRGIARHPASAAPLRLSRNACGGAGSVACLALVRDGSGRILDRFRLDPAR